MKNNIKIYNQILGVLYSVTLCISLLTISVAKFKPIPLSFISYSFGFLYFIIDSQSWFLIYLFAFSISLIAGIISSFINTKTIIFNLIITVFCLIDLFIGVFILTTQISEHTIYSIIGFSCLATDILLIGFNLFIIYKTKLKIKCRDES